MNIKELKAFGLQSLFITAFLVIGLVTFSSGCGGVSSDQVETLEMVAAGGASFRAYCAGCHGREGRGDGPAVEYMTIPRICALSEVLWSERSARDFGSFTSRLSSHLQDLKKLGYNLRPDDLACRS